MIGWEGLDCVCPAENRGRGQAFVKEVLGSVKYGEYNNNNTYLLQFGCHPVAVVILHVYKI